VSYKLVGSLVFGEVGSLQDVSARCTAVRIVPDVEEGDSMPTLDGGSILGEDTESASLTATLVQDIAAGGFTEWSWTNAGEEVPFEFIPVTGRTITGTVKVRRVEIGGDVQQKNTVDIEWPCVGMPTLGNDL
jgi:hypothetical protein